MKPIAELVEADAETEEQRAEAVRLRELHKPLFSLLPGRQEGVESKADEDPIAT